MREILFRGKRKDNNEWVCGDLSYHVYGTPHVFPPNGYDSADCYEVIPETVGQYTGLTDKNGKKIFEGDIVTGYFNHEKILGYIIYGSDATFFIQRDGLYGIGLNNAEGWLSVVGNVHDNPELLNGDNDVC